MDDQFSKIFATFVFGIIIFHFFINIGMNIGLIPIVGVTLPFVSYGGNSLLSNLVFLGILSNLYHINKRRKVLEIR
jgi:rod shape determining protein RodA